jgi:hypothetical protein
VSERRDNDGLIPLSPEEWAKRQPPRPWELMGASREPIATPEPRLLRCRPIRLLGATSAKKAALALALGLLSSPAAAHEWYSDLKIPAGPMAGSSCCGGNDCKPTTYCVLPSGKQGIVSRFGCETIPWSQVLGIASPDGEPHLCESPFTANFAPYCVILGGSS